MRKIRNIDGSIMIFGDDSSVLDREKYKWRYENGQDIDASMPGAPVEIRDSAGQLLGAYAVAHQVKPVKLIQPMGQLLDASAARHEADMMRPDGVPQGLGKFKGGTQVADVTVYNYPNAVPGPLNVNAGHNGIGVENDPSRGFYPATEGGWFQQGIGRDMPGAVKKDDVSRNGGVVRSFTIKTTPEQDKIIRAFIERRFREPGGYDFYERNCQDFVRDALAAAGIKTRPGATPNDWFDENYVRPYRKSSGW